MTIDAPITIDTDARRNAAQRRGAAVSSRPEPSVPYRRVGSLSSAKRDPATSETTYFVKAAATELLQFGEREYFLWRLLDGTNSVADIQGKFRGRFETPLTPEQFDSFVEQLVECGAVERLALDGDPPAKPGSAPVVASAPGQIEPELPNHDWGAPFTVRLFNPSVGLRALDLICGPLRYFRWLLLPAIVGVLIWCALDASTIAARLVSMQPMSTLGFAVPTLLGAGLALLVTGIVPPLSQAVMASFLGYATPTSGIVFHGRILPRLAFDDAAWRTMLSRHVLGVVAAPCIARLVLFTAGIGICLAARSAGDWLFITALAIGVLGLASFLISAAPFLPSQGRLWLATAFGRPNPWSAGGGYCLHAAALSAFWLVIVVAVGLVAADAVLAAVQPAWYGPATNQMLQSTALPLLVVIPIVSRLWIRGMVSSYGTPQPSYAYGRFGPVARVPADLPLDRWPPQSRMIVEAGATPPRRQLAERWGSTRPVTIWACVLGASIAIGFVSYPYEAGGYFTILPHDSSQLNARIAGELTEVLVNEGDKVEPGQILGMLSHWQQKYNLDAAKAQLESAEANLQNLLHSPQPEAIELARTQYEAALARLPYDKAQFARYAALVTNDNVSRANYDQVLSQYQQDQAAAEVARANYDQVRAGPTPDQIEAARAQVRQDTATVAFDEDQLERTRIRATSYGTVVTPNPMLLRGKWFAQGALVFTVEDHRVVQAEVQVPETDIDNIRLGGPVRLRLWGTPEETAIGKSISIAPDAQTPSTANPQDVQSGSSNVVRVLVEVPNPNGLLHPQTDGYAKMSGYHMPTWRAFGQMIERFFLVEIWSWIP
jgi:multidrug resistance efflux pump